ncbi:Alpha/Beta hydrolase protein [Mycena galericulata]|nr:Alpha/Beta hydrolase protein [Mycena galericulata]
MTLGALELFALVGFMGALLSLAARRNGSTLIHFAETSAFLKIRQPDGSTSTESLENLVSTKCPTLRSKFSPVWWLFNGHMHTLMAALGDFSKTDRLQYNRQLIRLLDGGTLGLDFAPADSSKLREDAPIIVVQHGLTGGSYESYVRSILVPACRAVEEGGLGYRAVVVNFRGCAGVPVTSPQLYSAGHTGDIRLALAYISQRYPQAPLLGLGFSLGANVLTRYLAEEGEQSRLISGCALACNFSLKSGFVGRIYSKAMATNLINLVRRNLDGLSKFPDHLISEYIPTVLNLKGATLEEFDDSFTRIAGGSPPDFPFASAQDYYKWGSSHNVVQNIRVPYLAINSADDPIVQHVPMNGGGNGMAVMALTACGGHLGWFQPVHPTQARGPRIYLEDGYYREEGRDGGYREIDGGGLVEASSWQGINIQGL